MDVTVVVPYTGEPWKSLAVERAIPSAEAQGVPVVVGQGATVAEARNDGLDQVRTKWTIHLDADDELAPGYVAALLGGSADVRCPATKWVRSARPQYRSEPLVPTEQTGDDLRYGNWLVIGAMVRTDIAQEVRWREWPVYEDYDFWQRCWLAGASFECVPEAVYVAWSRPDSRNKSIKLIAKLDVHKAICEANGLPYIPPGRRQ